MSEQKTAKLDPGIYPEIPMRAYINDPCPEPSMSKGVINTINTRTPLHAHNEHPRLGGESGGNSGRADIGSAAHHLVLGGEDVLVWIDASDYKTKAARAARDAAYAMDRLPLLLKDKQRIDDMAGPARELLKSHFGDGHTEQTALNRRHDVWLKCRPDFVATGGYAFVDLKTTKNADPRTWVSRTMYGPGYDIQGGLYYLAGRDLLAVKDPEVTFLLQEIDPPFACSIVEMSTDAISLAIRKVDIAAPVWRQCLDSGEWPGYSADHYMAVPPTWAVYEMEDRELAAGGGPIALTFNGEVFDVE